MSEREREWSRIGERMDRERKVNEAGRDIRVANRMAKCSQDNAIELMNVGAFTFRGESSAADVPV